MDRSYIAFISYKHTERDAAIAKLIHTLIENYVVPKALRTNGKKLGIVFRDEEELPIASNLSETICSALDATRYLIVICSKESKKSVWVSREVNYFLRNHDADSVFVVLVDGEPDDVFPHELTYVRDKKTGIYQNVEPLALDVRADSTAAALKKVKMHIRKLYAGMLGCSYDNLVHREKARKLRRIAALSTLGMLFAGCFIG
ncbi:MAG: toll/interleukin-1 receptor domain-containing protein, partial [Clostridia bacterium]|nr:toll/interleukin-1 receptor domain-containing protein [Clostridia bacterium]